MRCLLNLYETFPCNCNPGFGARVQVRELGSVARAVPPLATAPSVYLWYIAAHHCKLFGPQPDSTAYHN